MSYRFIMFRHGWVLLVVCLLMQAAHLRASSCYFGQPAPSTVAGGCASATCCCGNLDEAGGRSACECAESPVPDPSPTPFVPRPTTGEREALTAPVWVEAKPFAAGPLGRPRSASPVPNRRPVSRAALAHVPLTVRLQVFLI